MEHNNINNNLSEMYDIINEYRLLGFTWTQIRNFNDVAMTESQIKWWRSKSNYFDPLDTLENDNLDNIIREYILDNPNRGEIMTWGYLLSQGYRVTREKLRESICRVDPVNRERRRKGAVVRRVYNVYGPHHLWHIDGNHKLIKVFRAVIHGCIDGFTRKIIFLHIHDNNSASTVLSDFIKAVDKHGVLCERIRTDKGGENIDVARFMLEMRGLNRGSVLTGSSNHNQRIERLWYDVTRKVLFSYKEIFLYYINILDMDINNDRTCFIMHYLFLDRIEADLQQFVEAWNNHKVSTNARSVHTPTHNMTPNQLEQHPYYRSLRPPENVIEEELIRTYGIEGIIENNLQNNELNNNDDGDIPAVIIMPATSPFNLQQYEIFVSRVNKLTLNDRPDSFKQKIIQAFIEMDNILNS
jgi:hypothetical protein